MKKNVILLICLSLFISTLFSKIIVESLEISSTTYKTEGQIPFITTSIKNISDKEISNIKLELKIDESKISDSVWEFLKPDEIKEIHFPWFPEIGIKDYFFELQVVWDVDRVIRSVRNIVLEQNTGSKQIDSQKEIIFKKEFKQIEIRHDDDTVHPWLTRKGNEFLQSKYPNGEYQEIADHIDFIAEGSIHEDAGSVGEIGDGNEDNDNDPVTERPMRHFYRPTDDSGLKECPGYPWYQFSFAFDFPNSYEWGSGAVECNEYDWQDAIGHYLNEDKEAAYFAFGHVIHLLEDLNVPAHTHLDIHAGAFGIGGDDFENYCDDMTPDQYTSSLPVPEPDDTIICFDSLRAFWENPGASFPNCGMANLSYYRNYYPCDLPNLTGRLKEMYPNLYWDWLWGQWDIDDPDLGNWDEDFGTVYPDYDGSMGDDEWWECTANYDNPDVPGYYYLEWLQEVPQIEKSSWDPTDPENDVYAANTEGKSHVEIYADQLIPLCIRYAAGMMKYFYDTINGMLAPPQQVFISILEDSVRLEWSEVPDAISYNIYSSSHPDDGFVSEGTTSELFYVVEILADKKFFRVSSNF